MRRILTGLLSAALVAGLAPAAAATQAAIATQAAAAPEQQVLFKAANEQGYSCFRIPAVVKSVKNTLLAFAEGRVDNCGDTGDIDLVLKRSTDGGRTWSPLQLVNEGGGDTHGNPVPIVDRTTGRIFLFTTYNAGRNDDKACATPCPRTPHLQYSDDDGATWSDPVDLSAQAKLPEWDWWYATGPVHGIQLTKGAHKGRLVLGVSGEVSDGKQAYANDGALVYSDDHGRTWQVGANGRTTFPKGGTFTQKPQEVTVTELADGSVYAGARDQNGTSVGNRSYAISKDGGATFSTQWTPIPDLVTPTVQGSVLRLDRPGADRMLFSAPSDTDRRRWMMIRSSYDGGRSWESAEQGTRITADWSGYSDLVQISGNDVANAEVGLLYEGGPVDARDEIRFTRFTESNLGPRGPVGPTTPDTSRTKADAYVLGGASLTAGKFGGGLELDGVDDYLRVPYAEEQLPGDGDLTYTAWFRYGASTGQQALLWLGGMGSTAPQLWLRGEPASNRLVALMTTAQGSASIATTSAYNDNQWHHVVLQRAGGKLTLWVDGQQAATGNAVGGSISERVAFQIHLGERQDYQQRFDGAFDEVRLYKRALSSAELDQIRQSNADVPSGQVLRLPMDKLKGADGACTSVPFVSGTEGYHTFRIPAIVKAGNGSVLAFAEGRLEGGGDSGAIRVVLKQSTDGGCTWGPLSVVSENSDATAGNPAPVVLANGDVVLLTTRNGRVSEKEIMSGTASAADSRRVFVQRSTDDGRSWSPAQEITDVAKKAGWRWYATGPGHAIVLQHGEHKGRIVVPANHSGSPPAGSTDMGTEAKYYGGHDLISDDGGRTWRIGFAEERADTGIAANESTVAELPDGSLYFNSRNQGATGNRVDAYSTDGGTSLVAPYQPQPGLTIPKVQGSVLQTNRPDLLLFSGPSDPSARKALAIRASSDRGRTWRQALVVSPAPAAYSDLVQLSGATVGLLYETGVTGTYESITYTQIPMRNLG
ncbi:exo-alpha-sialidase [Amycolatopsis taiwanensis]|uniref:exo-alpha-sialidase n=1 Tax=Amycolatopsis taiwanensis TaxID=342230 RepID=UPI0004B8D6D4